MPWEEDREDGSAAAGLNAAADADGSTVFADDALAYPKPEAGSEGFLGGEKRFVEPLDGWGGHAIAGVGDSNADAAAGAVPRGGLANAHGEIAAVGHSVECIADQVGKHLANLSGVAHERPTWSDF